MIACKFRPIVLPFVKKYLSKVPAMLFSPNKGLDSSEEKIKHQTGVKLLNNSFD